MDFEYVLITSHGWLGIAANQENSIFFFWNKNYNFDGTKKENEHCFNHLFHLEHFRVCE